MGGLVDEEVEFGFIVYFFEGSVVEAFLPDF